MFFLLHLSNHKNNLKLKLKKSHHEETFFY